MMPPLLGMKFIAQVHLLLAFIPLALSSLHDVDVAVLAQRGPLNDLRIQCAAVSFIVAEVCLWQTQPLERVLIWCAAGLGLAKVKKGTLQKLCKHCQQCGEVPEVAKRWRSRKKAAKEEEQEEKAPV